MPLIPEGPVSLKDAVQAELLKLAVEGAAGPAVPLPGQTIAQGAAAAGKAAGAGHTGAPRKVATALGSAKYKAPIGALIIPHYKYGNHGGHEHFIQGQPGHWDTAISEAKWVANQWKDKDKAEHEFHKGLSEGTHKLVQAGPHEFAVHKDIDVHVPKHTDLSNPEAVKNAPKMFTKKDEHGEPVEHLNINAAHPSGSHPIEHNDTAADALSKYWKPLHSADTEPEHKKAVTFAGKHAAWVPDDWKVYQATGTEDENTLAGKWAQDPQGNWHAIQKDGKVGALTHPGAKTEMDSWVKNKVIEPAEGKAAEHAALPVPEHKGTAEPTVGVPAKQGEPINVTKAQLAHAISVLNETKNTLVNAPLQKAGHPLHAMDYHAIAAAEIAKHPELNIAGGTKKEHVGKVKNAILHYLGGRAAHLAKTEAEAQVFQEAQDKAQAEAAHAQELTPHTFDIGGVEATKEQIQDAIDILQSKKNTLINGPLNHAGNPLGKSDYWKVVHDYEAAHPTVVQHGTKQAHVGKAKALFIAALQEKAGLLAKADAATGHDEKAQLYDLVKNGEFKEPGAVTASWGGGVVAAAQSAVASGKPYYAHHELGQWKVMEFAPPEPWYKITPQLTIESSLGNDYTPQLENMIKSKLQLPDKNAKPEPAKVELPKEAVDAALGKVAPALPEWANEKEWKASPKWKDLHALAGEFNKTLEVYDKRGSGQYVQRHLARTLWQAQAVDATRYLVKENGKWAAQGVKPLEGMPGAELKYGFYEVTPDHRVILHAPDGHLVPATHDTVMTYIKNGTKEMGKAEVPAPPAGWNPAEPSPEVQKIVQEATAVPQGHDEALAELKDKLAEVAKSEDQPPPAGVPFIRDGVYVGDFPPGSVLYEKPNNYGHKDVFARDPSGQWWWFQSSYNGGWQLKEAPSYYAADTMIGGVLVNMEPPSAAEVAHGKEVAAALELLKNGAMGEEKAVGHAGFGGQPVFATKYLAAAYELSTGSKAGGSHVTIIAAPDGTGFMGGYPGNSMPYLMVDKSSLQVRLVGAGESAANVTPDPAEQAKVLEAVNAAVTANSLVVDGKLYQFGFHKNPKNDVYILIQPASYPEYWKYGTAGYGKYIYHDTKGQIKEVTPKFAAGKLPMYTQYSSDAPAKEEKAPTKVAFATAFAPGSYKLWENDAKGVGTSTVEVKADGSAVLDTEGGATLPLDQSTVTQLLKGGAILDQHGNTVVKPGLEPLQYHVWGSPARSPAEAKAMLDWLDANPQDVKWTAKWQEFLVAWDQTKLHGKSFMIEHGLAGGTAQRAAATALLRELLAVPKLPEGAFLGAKEEGGSVKAAGPSFLKDMPEGIHSAKDIFTWTQQGNALPYQGSFPLYPTSLTKPELKAKVTEIAQEFGGGKVVGTHLSSLSAQGLTAWLDAWKKGDMAKVFELDASGGKVSPAHPGAPDNAETHQITWSAKDPTQVPAATDIPGDWSNLSEVPQLPKAEVDNYLIKMGFKHAEYLSAFERHSAVRAHRAHQQDSVDNYTGLANERMAAGAAPQTEVPMWTDGLKPAKAYDQPIKDNTPAVEWPMAALKSFANDHMPELTQYLTPLAVSYGYSDGQALVTNGHWSYVAQAIGQWQENEHAKVVAEQMVPVWKKIPADIKESHGHEVLKATKTIPYTGEVTTYFIKPAPNGKDFRLEQEHAANLLGRMFGFQTAESLLLHEKDIAPGLVQAQKAVPGAALGHYTDMPPWSQFTDVQVADIATEHLLDWVLSNDDSSANNMIKTPAGRIVGIDKGRSWGDMNWDGLSGTSAADSMTQLVYTKLYNAIRSHQLTKDQADKAFLAVISRARKMQAVPDASVTKVLEQGFAHRDKWPAGGKKGLIEEILRRKNSLVEDFTKLYEQVYKDAGIGALPEIPQQSLPDMHGSPLHAGFGEAGFMEHLDQAKSHGIPAFFGGRGLRDMHVLVWRRKDGSGTETTHGETFMRGAAYDKVVAWLKSKASPHGGAAAAPVEDNKVSYPGDSYGPGKPPAGSPDRGGVTAEAMYYNTIIRAARSVTKHKTDGDYTSQSSKNIQNELDSVQAKLEQLKGHAEQVLASHPNENDPGNRKAQLEIGVAKLYLDHIALVRQAKENATGFKEGDLPRFLPPNKAEPAPNEPTKDELAQAGIKLEFGHKEQHFNGSLNANGELVASPDSSQSDPGKFWRMTLPEGEQIIFGDGNDTGINVAHWGRVRFVTPHNDAASLERIRQALQLAGLDMTEAQAQDFELFYWRHLLALMSDRADAGQQPVWAALHDQFQAHGLHSPGASSTDHAAFTNALEQLGQQDPQAEVDIFRKAFASLTSEQQVQDWVDRGGVFPVQKHFDPYSPQTANGKPDWYRFDLMPSTLPAPIRQSENFYEAAMKTVKSGGTYSRDALMRTLGKEASGQSNPYSSGATSYVFTRLNTHGSSQYLMLSPLVMARSRNYSFPSDMFGVTVSPSKGGYSSGGYRAANAYWKPSVWKGYHGGSNETMISDALSVLDDIELLKAASEPQRQEIIQFLHDRGIHEIRHMPVEDRIVTSINSTTEAKVKANWAAHPELLDPFGQQPPAVAAEQKAEGAALDTPPAAQAAETGRVSAFTSENLTQVLDHLDAVGNYGKEPPVIYALHVNDPSLFYAKFPDGQWYSFESGPGGTDAYPETGAVFNTLNAQVNDGIMKKVWSPPKGSGNTVLDSPPAPAAGASPPGWSPGSDGSLQNPAYPGAKIVKGLNHWYPYGGTNNEYLGTSYATAGEAALAIANEAAKASSAAPGDGWTQMPSGKVWHGHGHIIVEMNGLFDLYEKKPAGQEDVLVASDLGSLAAAKSIAIAGGA